MIEYTLKFYGDKVFTCEIKTFSEKDCERLSDILGLSSLSELPAFLTTGNKPSKSLPDQEDEEEYTPSNSYKLKKALAYHDLRGTRRHLMMMGLSPEVAREITNSFPKEYWDERFKSADHDTKCQRLTSVVTCTAGKYNRACQQLGCRVCYPNTQR